MEPTLADLEIATFAVDEVVEGTQTGWSDGRLTLSLPQLAVGAGEPALAEATVEVVRPGDAVRISNVLDVVLPSVESGGARIHRLNGVAVLVVCDWAAAGYTEADELPDSLVDMAGPGADRSPWGATTDIVVRCVPVPGIAVAEADRVVRATGAAISSALAAPTVGSAPKATRTIGALPPVDASLPPVALVLQAASEGPLLDTFLDLIPLRDLEPRPIDPAALFSGRLTNGAYDWPGVRNVTAIYQELALVRRLQAEHGKRLRFAGIVLAPGYLDGAEQKRRAAEASAALVDSLGARGVICTTFSSGNSHTDTMLTVAACERRGIGTVALVCETNGGLTDHVPEADCLVSTGNEDELVEAWVPDRIIGGERRARSGERGPRRALPRRVGARRATRVVGGAGMTRAARDARKAGSMTVVHYLNQFFAGLGGEEAAGHEPVRLDGAQGPGRGLAGAGLTVDVTLACGDDYFGEHEEESLATLLGWLEELEPDVLVCGPSFGSGRYGYACGVLAREVGRRGIPVVAAMTPDSPGVLAAEGAAYIVPTGPNVAGMRDGAPGRGVARDPARRRRAGRGARGRGVPAARPPRERAVPSGPGPRARSTCCSRSSAGDVRTEVAPRGDRVAASAAGRATSATVTPRARHRGGLRARRGTRIGCRPGTRTSGSATRSRASTRSVAGDYESVHAGFDTTAANARPEPARAARCRS